MLASSSGAVGSDIWLPLPPKDTSEPVWLLVEADGHAPLYTICESFPQVLIADVAVGVRVTIRNESATAQQVSVFSEDTPLSVDVDRLETNDTSEVHLPPGPYRVLVTVGRVVSEQKIAVDGTRSRWAIRRGAIVVRDQ